jgi:hypothetical protein
VAEGLGVVETVVLVDVDVDVVVEVAEEELLLLEETPYW